MKYKKIKSKEELTIGKQVRWIYKKETNEVVIIASNIIGSCVGSELIRIDHIKKNGKIKEGGFIRIDELYYVDKVSDDLGDLNTMNTEKFKTWKTWFSKQHPEDFSMFDDKTLYEIYSMNP